ncbi:MAG: hypothetical protein ACYCT3_10535 [Acidiferrobacter sp.]
MSPAKENTDVAASDSSIVKGAGAIWDTGSLKNPPLLSTNLPNPQGSDHLIRKHSASWAWKKQQYMAVRRMIPSSRFLPKRTFAISSNKAKRVGPLRTRILKSTFEKANKIAASRSVTLNLGSSNPLFLPKYENLTTSETNVGKFNH